MQRIVCLALCSVLAFVVSRLQEKRTTAAPMPAEGALTVTTEPVTMHSIEQDLAISGLISAWDPVSVGSEVGGLRIEAINAEEGQSVKQGEVLAVLNARLIRTSLEEARAQLRAGQAGLAKAIQPNRREDINALRSALLGAEARVAQERSDLMRAVAQLEQARISAVRMRTLADQGAVSSQDAENAETLVKTTTAEVHATEQRIRAARFAAEQVKEHLTMARAGGRREDIDAVAADLSRAEATVHRLEAQIEQTAIRAPVDGLIVRRDAHVGDITVSGRPLFSIVRSGRLEVKGEIAERDIAKVRTGQSVEITCAAYPERLFNGTVRTISPQVDLHSHMGTVRIDLAPQSCLMSGMFVQARVHAGQRDCRAVPLSAISHEQGKDVVFTVEGCCARSHIVSLGERRGEMVEVTAGVSDGDRIVVVGAGLLKDGDPVRVAPSKLSEARRSL